MTGDRELSALECVRKDISSDCDGKWRTKKRPPQEGMKNALSVAFAPRRVRFLGSANRRCGQLRKLLEYFGIAALFFQGPGFRG